jgi:leucine dehydrogenase
MGVFTHPEFAGHELVEYVHEAFSGLRAIIAIHSTVLGPAGGGIRFHPYPDDDAALTDVLRLSRAMTNKMAMGGVPLGGGKSVIIGDPTRDKSDAVLEAFGSAVEALGGRYICGEDVGMAPRDMDVVARRTVHARGTTAGSGDTAPLTARTVMGAMVAAVAHRFGSPELGGRRVAIQGVGAVGSTLARMLVAAGAEVVLADIDAERSARLAEDLGATAVGADRILAFPADVLAPCALGAVLSEATIPTIAASIVCGAANNQLATTADGDRLHATGVLYVPDYVANVGGVYSAVSDRRGVDVAEAKADAVGPRVAALLERASAAGVAPVVAADAMVDEILAAAR